MDKFCVSCARRTFGNRSVVAARAQIGTRSYSVFPRSLDDKRPQDAGVAKSGRPIAAALRQSKPPTSQPPKLVIRRVSEPEQSSTARRSSPSASNPILRRTDSGKTGQDRTQAQGAVLRRSSGPQAGQAPRRAGAPPTGQVLNRTRSAGAAGGSAGPRPAGTFLRRPGQGQGQDQQGRRVGAGAGQKGGKQPDRRRRIGPKQDEEEVDEKGRNQNIQELITKYVDRPANPTEPLPYNPTRLTLDDLKSDWPNTPLSTSGMTESVIQKVEWLARRLPHGYQSPEQIVEHYLKGNLTRFESEEEKTLVLKLASELSAKTKTEEEDGTSHKHETPRFRVVEDTTFTSIASKSADKDNLVNPSVRGDYGQVQQQKYAFMQNVGRLLHNNETYGPVQAEKLLARVQALIPQARPGVTQQAKRA